MRTKKSVNYAEMAREALKWMVRESRTTGRNISNPVNAAELAALTLAASGDLQREHFGLICLNSANTVLDARILSSGTVNQAPAYPREIARAALLVNATAVLIFHNHPGNQCRPSADDLQLTREVKAALAHLDIQVHDHLVIAGNEAFSIAAGQTYTFASAAEPALF